MEFNVLIEKDEDGWYVASVPDIPGCYTQGKSVPQVLERIKEAIEVCLGSSDGKSEKVIPLRFIGMQRVEVSNG